MNTWEQRMAERRNVHGTKAYRREMEYQRARAQAIDRIRQYVKGPGVLPPEYPSCCWDWVWMNCIWAMSPKCNYLAKFKSFSYMDNGGPLCNHEHHRSEIWLAA